MKKFESDSVKFRQYEMTLNMPESKFENLEYLRGVLNLRLDMWRGLRDWISLTDKWMNMKFEEINVEEIKQDIQEHYNIYISSVYRLIRSSRPNSHIRFDTNTIKNYYK